VPVSSGPALQAAIINGFSVTFYSQTFNAIPNSFVSLSTTTSSQGSSGSGSTTGPIIGGVVGGVLLLVLIVVVIYVRRRGHGLKPGPISDIEDKRGSLVETNYLVDLPQTQTTSSSAGFVHLHNNALYSGGSETSVDEVPLSPNAMYGEVPLAPNAMYGEVPLAANAMYSEVPLAANVMYGLVTIQPPRFDLI
jgi:hypothetical protein